MIFKNVIPVLSFLVLTIFAWPSFQSALGNNGVFIGICAIIPLLTLKDAPLSKIKLIISQIVFLIFSIFTFYHGLKEMDWNKHHWLVLHAITLSLILFFNFAFFKRSTEQAMTSVKRYLFSILPSLFICFFLFWYLKSTHGVTFSFQYLWFFISLSLTTVYLFTLLDDSSSFPSPPNDIYLKTLFYLSFFLFITTFIWSLRIHFDLQTGESRLLWGVSLFLVFAGISNGLDPRYRESQWGKINSLLYISLALLQLIFSIIELAKYGPVESRYYHFFISLVAIVIFVPNFIRYQAQYPLRLNFLAFLLVLTFISPLNISKLSLAGQKKRLWSIFEKNKMTRNNKIIPTPQKISNEDRLAISSIFRYIYHEHEIKELKGWFNFDIEKVFQNATPFVVTADFNRDLSNLKALLSQLGLNYAPRASQKRNQQAKKRISFHLLRLKGETNGLNIAGYHQIIKDYARPFSVKTKIKNKDVLFHFNKKDNVLETTIDSKVVHRINLLEKYSPFMAIDEKQRHLSLDLHPAQMDIKFDTELFSVKIIINRIQGYIQAKEIHFNHIDALTLINY